MVSCPGSMLICFHASKLLYQSCSMVLPTMDQAVMSLIALLKPDAWSIF
jgi:hypothetical protein